MDPKHKLALIKRVYPTRFSSTQDLEYCYHCCDSINKKHLEYHKQSIRHKTAVKHYGPILKDSDILAIKVKYLNKCLDQLEYFRKSVNNDIKEISEILTK